MAAACERLDGGSCCAGEAGSEPEASVAERGGGERDDADSEGERCPCPFSCAAGCAGLGARALPVRPFDLLEIPAVLAELGHPAEARAPPSAEGFKILHVPKRSRA